MATGYTKQGATTRRARMAVILHGVTALANDGEPSAVSDLPPWEHGWMSQSW